MVVKGRWKSALAMGLLWAVVMAAALYYLDLGLDGSTLLILLFSSIFLMVLGLIIYMGGAMLLAGYNTMSKEQRAQYNVNEITSFMGALLVLLSIVAFFMVFYLVLIAVFIGATIVAVIYVNVSKRFKADMPRRL